MKPWVCRVATHLLLTSFLFLAGVAPTAANVTPDNASGGKKLDLAAMNLEQLLEVEVKTVSTAAKHEQKISDAPSAVSVITAAEIKLYGFRTLAEALRSLVGFYSVSDRRYSYVGIRGFNRPGDYNSRILLLVNGLRLNDTVYDTAPMGRDLPFDLDLVDRIEVVRGPSASIYGNNAFFGVVNVILRKPAALSSFETTTRVDSMQGVESRLTWSGPANRGRLLLSGNGFASPGQKRIYFQDYDDAAHNNGIEENCDREEQRGVYGQFTRGNFTLQSGYSFRRKGLVGAPYDAEFNNEETDTIDFQTFLGLSYRMPCRDGSTLDLHFFNQCAGYDGHYVYDFANQGDPPALVKQYDSSRGERRSIDGAWTKRLNRHHSLVLGFEVLDFLRQSQNTSDVAVRLDDHRSQRARAVYLEDEWVINRRLRLSAGGRCDSIDGFGTRVTPRFALIAQPRPDRTVKLMYGQSFRAPNAYERYYNDGAITQKINPNLGAERNDMWELAYETPLHRRHTTLRMSVFRYRLRDLIDMTVDPDDDVQVFRNLGQVDAEGLELALSRRWQGGLRTDLGWSWQRTSTDLGASLSNAPTHLGQIRVSRPFRRLGIDCAVETLVTGPRTDTAGNPLAAQTLVNFNILRRMPHLNFDLALRVTNLLDHRLVDPVPDEYLSRTMPADGRVFRLDATYRF